MKKIIAVVGILLSTLAWAEEDPQALFENPPDAAKPRVWWHWMGCNVTKGGITRDLESFKDAGIGGATIFAMADTVMPWASHIENSPTDGLIAFTEPWWELVRHAASEAKRLGLDLGIHNCPGYTHSGGPWITPELSMQEVCFSATPLEGGKKWSGILPKPSVDPRARALYPVVNKDTGKTEMPIIEGRKTYYSDIVVLACPAEGVVSKEMIQNLTPALAADGKIEWEAPPGKWIIYRIGHTTMGAFTQPNQWEVFGLESDKMSLEATEFHMRHVLGEMRKHLGNLVGTGLKHVLFDSYEAGTPSWTPKMPEEFASRRGYDITPFMLTFAGRTVGSEQETRKFKVAFTRTIQDLYRDIHFATVSQMLKEANLEFQCEPYGGPFNTAEVSPYLTRVMTEFWSMPNPRFGNPAILLNAGNGKRHNILEAEAFTGAANVSQWSEHPASLKKNGDAAFCAGINRLVLHANPHQPWDDHYRPGMTMGLWGTHFGRTQTWWEPGKSWIAYLQRCQALLQWGAPGSADSFSLSDKDIDATVIKSKHRQSSKGDLFFIANQSDVKRNTNANFKISGRVPELWNPVTGEIREPSEFHDDGKTISIPLVFEPLESWFVVFRKPAAKNLQAKNFPELKSVAELSGSWEVEFDPKWGGPEKPITFDTLTDWTQRPEKGIKYYSGTAVYRKTFDAPESATHLDLGTFHHLARVQINGKDLGVLWCPPNRLALPKELLKPSGNKLAIEITNVWANRLIGDEQESPDCEWSPGARGNGGFLKRFPDWFVKNEPRPSKGRYCFTTWNYFKKNSPLVPSGLVGPVTLLAE